jgi:pilus assembly protein CpaF
MREELLNEIRAEVVAQLIEKTPWIDQTEIERESSTLQNWSTGYGPFTELIATENFTDFFFNGSAGAWINREGKLEPIPFDVTERALIHYIRSQALRVGKHFDQAHPAVDLELGKGIRLHGLLPPLIEGGVHVSLRVNQQRAIIEHDQNLEELFDLIITRRRNFLISGGTGSGKTTLLSHIIENFPERERLLVIEDTHEIQVQHPHVLRLQARPQNSEGLGEVPVRELIRQALRMKPDRIFLGEIRGADVLDLFLALNTGHAGSGATIHANSPEDIPNRIAALAMMSGIAREGALALYSSSIDLIIHLDGRRNGNRIAAIVEIDK